MINLAIIGCGNMGRTHAKSLSRIPEANIHTLADPHQPALDNLSEQIGGAHLTTEIKSVFADRAIDAVLICTHHHLHKPYCQQAAAAGKHVFVEKPLALSVAECLDIEKAVEAAGVKCMVGFQARFSPFIRKLKEVIPHPLLTVGQIIDPRWGDQIWANDPVQGGGNVLSQGCHTFDIVWWLNESEPVSIFAEGGNVHHPGLSIADLVVSTLRFENGAVASCIAGDIGRNPYLGKCSYQLYDGKKTATLYDYYGDNVACAFSGTDEPGFALDDLPEDQREHLVAHGYAQEMAAFLDWIENGTVYPEAATARDGTRATAMSEKAIAAALEHQPQSF